MPLPLANSRFSHPSLAITEKFLQSRNSTSRHSYSIWNPHRHRVGITNLYLPNQPYPIRTRREGTAYLYSPKSHPKNRKIKKPRTESEWGRSTCHRVAIGEAARRRERDTAGHRGLHVPDRAPLRRESGGGRSLVASESWGPAELR